MANYGKVGDRNNISQVIGEYIGVGKDPIESQVERYVELMNKANKKINDTDVAYKKYLTEKKNKEDAKELKKIQDEV